MIINSNLYDSHSFISWIFLKINTVKNPQGIKVQMPLLTFVGPSPEKLLALRKVDRDTELDVPLQITMIIMDITWLIRRWLCCQVHVGSRWYRHPQGALCCSTSLWVVPQSGQWTRAAICGAVRKSHQRFPRALGGHLSATTCARCLLGPRTRYWIMPFSYDPKT